MREYKVETSTKIQGGKLVLNLRAIEVCHQESKEIDPEDDLIETIQKETKKFTEEFLRVRGGVVSYPEWFKEVK